MIREFALDPVALEAAAHAKPPKDVDAHARNL